MLRLWLDNWCGRRVNSGQADMVEELESATNLRYAQRNQVVLRDQRPHIWCEFGIDKRLDLRRIETKLLKHVAPTTHSFLRVGLKKISKRQMRLPHGTGTVDKQFSGAIQHVCDEFLRRRYGPAGAPSVPNAKSRGWQHDIVRSMHFAVLLCGRRLVGNAVTNAVNIRDSFRGPRWTRAQDVCDDRSIHAESRAAYRAHLPEHAQSKRRRRKAMRQSVGSADGILVCRFSSSGRLCFSLPCSKCVEVLARNKFRFVVYSTGDEARPWHKISLCQLLCDDRVQPVRRLRPVDVRTK